MAALQSNLICIAALLLSAVNQSYAFALPALEDPFGSPLLDARSSNNNHKKSSTARKLAKGAIIGIAVGIAVFVLIIVALIVCCCMRRRKSKKAREIGQ